MQRILELATQLGLSRGELLKLARENLYEQALHDDGVLISIERLRMSEQLALIGLLETMLVQRAELAGLTSELTTR